MDDINYDTFAYKVENNTIVNVTIVPLDFNEEGFIKRPWKLGIGYVYNSDLADFYPEGITAEALTAYQENLDNQIEQEKTSKSERLSVINTEYFTPNEEGTLPEVPESISSEKIKLENYLSYLDTAKDDIQNAYYQKIKTYEDM